jgi:hypothetical protein
MIKTIKKNIKSKNIYFKASRLNIHQEGCNVQLGFDENKRICITFPCEESAQTFKQYCNIWSNRDKITFISISYEPKENEMYKLTVHVNDTIITKEFDSMDESMLWYKDIENWSDDNVIEKETFKLTPSRKNMRSLSTMDGLFKFYLHKPLVK